MGRRVRLLCALLAAGSCASAPRPPPRRPVPIRPAAHSSIEAVLGQRTQLRLTDDQARALAAVDARLQQQNQDLRAELERRRALLGKVPGEPANPAAPGAGDRPSGTSPADEGFGGPRGAGRGGGMGGMGGMGGHAGRHRGGGSAASGPRDRPPTAQEQMDDNDVAAFLEAEALLDDEQRPRAREVAERYREELFEWREAMRARRSGEGTERGAGGEPEAPPR